MKTKSLLASAVVFSALHTGTFAADLQSGPAVGEVPNAFKVLDVTGPNAGQEVCYRCNYSIRPVVSVFARTTDGNVQRLITELDRLVGEKDDQRLAAFVVLLTNDKEKAETSLKEFARVNEIRHTPLTVFSGTKGPNKYRIAEEADITVTMWTKSDVKATRAYRLADLDDAVIDAILGDTAKILTPNERGFTR